ncbi:MAG: DEAD/DEAH box helicase family protein [Candidatus Aminicenantes bacterium]|jgi:type I restriction enzyme R subunit
MTPGKITSEQAFEEAIEYSLCKSGGYVKGISANFSKDLAFDKDIVLEFIKSSQPQSWQKLQTIHGTNVETKFILRLFNELDNRGTLDVLRHGFIDYGVRFKMAFFKPASGLNPETLALYQKNILSVYRQVFYSKDNNYSIDMLLGLNGLPIATVELKNPFTGQDVYDAREQYELNRDPRELLFQFKKRALVHFALDPDLVYMTTRLAGKKTYFLPFNKGYNRGAGNPPNPNGHKTAFLWEDIWAKDKWLDIIGNFLHLQKEEDKSEKLIFPRYHQLDVVHRLTEDARQAGPGKNYLVQHSTGSGKSNSIAWLAYRLSSLHNQEDKRVFDSVIVITDRKILDRQLQNTIYQFEHKTGVVEPIDKNSKQLADALTAGTNIIITTLQKFPFVLDNIDKRPKRNYALIVDEAHSSQGGESSQYMKSVLTVIDMTPGKAQKIGDEKPKYETPEEEKDPEDNIREMMLKRGKQPNLSFFAFTATPKPKTLEVFGVKNQQGKPEPFHLYSMRQAIEENFIMDVLECYTTYKTYFRLTKAIEDDPKVNKKKARRAIARYVSLHPHNLAQKTEVMIEHFHQSTMKQINGKAKAMLVTASRPHVIRYKAEFDKYIKEKGYKIKTLVAFSPFTDKETGIQYTEYEFNQIKEKELPKKFASDKYQILIAADKYQTGFDQPLLHTMYVDKKLSGVKAVQTLSRLNRIYPGKENTFILDFANEEEEIQVAFQDYYEKTILSETTDPNKLYDLKNKIDNFQVVWPSEVETFANIFFKSEKLKTRKEHGQLNAIIQPAVDRYNHLETEEQKEDFKHTLTVFIRLYSFLAQIMPFDDIELEKFYAYSRFLLSKLPHRGPDSRFKLDDEVALEYYRLQKIREGKIALERGLDGELPPITDAGAKQEQEEMAPLSEIIALMNERFGTHFTENDLYFIRAIGEDMLLDETLGHQAMSNTIENFKYGFENMFMDTVIKRREMNENMFARIMDDTGIREFVMSHLLPWVYRRLRRKE